MSGTPTWELFEAISYQGDPPPYILLREGWVENDHTAILEKKDEIASFEFANEWELRKKITNPYEAIFSTSDTKSFPSLALVNPLSRSYFKMVEMSYVADIWGSITTPIVSAHICEGPGGFLQCTVEQGKQRGKLKELVRHDLEIHAVANSWLETLVKISEEASRNPISLWGRYDGEYLTGSKSGLLLRDSEWSNAFYGGWGI